MSVPAIASTGIGLVAPIIANEAGIGKNKERAKTFDQTAAYNPHAFQYGGTEGAADETANRFSGLASDAQNRAAPQAANVGVNYANANMWDRRSGQAYANQGTDRGQQNQVARMMMARAQGLVPSIAQQQAQLDMQHATASQASAGASARGAAGLALAGQNAANNTATMQSAISNQAQINTAQERLAAEQGAFGAYSGIRSGDAQQQQLAMQGQAQNAQQSQYAAQLGAQQNQYNAGLQAQRNAQNDAYSMGLYNQEADVRRMQMTGGMNQQQMLSGSQMAASQLNMQNNQYNANREYGYYQQGLGALQGGLTGATMFAGGGGGGGAPATGVSAPPTGVGAGGSTNMVGIPQAGTGSDDRMKMGMSPLGLLGMGSGSNMNPTSGPAASSYEVLGGGGEDVAASGRAMNAAAMKYQTDPTSYGDGPGAHGSMMNQGLLSDDRAKRAVYIMGRQDGAQQARSGEPVPYSVGSPPTDGEEFVVGKNGPEIRLNGLGQTREAVAAARAQRPVSLDRDAAYYPTQQAAPAPAPSRAGSMFDRDAAQVAPQRVGRHYTEESEADPITQQFAMGLAPISYEYKPGMGPGGRQTGVRAQAAASQPITSSMITKRPDGLLQIDPQMGLGTALAAAGNASQKSLALEARQREQEAKLNGLLALSARREGY